MVLLLTYTTYSVYTKKQTQYMGIRGRIMLETNIAYSINTKDNEYKIICSCQFIKQPSIGANVRLGLQ